MPKLSFFIRHSLPFTTLFFVVLTIVATAIMLIDWYVPTLILGISVAVAMGVYYRVGKYLAVDESSYDWLLIAFVVLWVGINGFLASEHIFTNRDPATYANTAIKLSKDQTINIPQTHLFNQVAGASERSAGFSLNEETDNIDT